MSRRSASKSERRLLRSMPRADTCPACGSDKSGVIDTRRRSLALKRRRKCIDCGERWTTYELRAEMVHAMRDMPQIIDHAERIASLALTARESVRQLEEDFKDENGG